jgi:hypothetical protein
MMQFDPFVSEPDMHLPRTLELGEFHEDELNGLLHAFDKNRVQGASVGQAGHLPRSPYPSRMRSVDPATVHGNHAQGQGRQHQDDNRGTGPLYAGLARLFRLLRDARGTDGSHSLGPVATAGRSVASVENTTSPTCRADRTASLQGTA